MTSLQIHPKTIERMSKLAGMTGSSHDGEALNALRLLGKLVSDCGLTWEEVVRAGCSNLNPAAIQFDGAGGPPPYPRDPQATNRPSGCQPHAAEALWALQHLELLTPKEAGFLRNMARQRSPISAKQQDWLSGIVDRLRSEVAA